jgi:hypothetical protein
MSKNKPYTCIRCDRSKVCKEPEAVCDRCVREDAEYLEEEQRNIEERVRLADKPSHACPDFDFLMIEKGWDEMVVCQCDFSATALWNKIGQLEKEINEMKKELEDRKYEAMGEDL